MQENIVIKGAREHNLQDVNLSIPRESLTVFSGVSGSGKSSLAYDTIFKEGQRRFIESLSAYARQFLGTLEKPKVDSIEGLSPAVCIDQKRQGRNPRSTVGTVTEIYDHLRLLFARLGVPHCPGCGKKIRSQTVDQIVQLILAEYDGCSALVLSPMVIERKGEYRKELAHWAADGFVRVRVDGQVRRLDEEIALARYEKHTLELVIDRLEIADKARGRLSEAIEQAVHLTKGLVSLEVTDKGHRLFSTALACPACGISLPEMEPRLFSFNNPQGACPACDGLGLHEEFDPERLVADANKSIADGALACLKEDGCLLFSKQGLAEIKRMAQAGRVDLQVPWRHLPNWFQHAVLYGPGQSLLGRWFGGIIPHFQKIFSQWNLCQLRPYLRVSVCSQCAGTRLRSESMCVLFRDYRIAQLTAMTVKDLMAFFGHLKLSEREALIGREMLKEIRVRLSFLNDVGLEYLTLDRRANTLAGGEAQRIRLARQLGAGLQGVLYVLDEPSIGMHPRDNARLLKALRELRDLGNCVIVIEHDEETIRQADHVVDIGPGAGKNGGHVVAQGPPSAIAQCPTSLTGQFLSGQCCIALPKNTRAPGPARLRILGATEHNLQNIDVEIPLGLFVVVTGVSGSGKSTLIDDILKRALAREFYGASDIPGQYRAIEGMEQLDKVIEVDQSPIGRTPRSNPATYTKLFDEIRQLFAMLPISQTRGYKPGRFSFNVEGGRCAECHGAGIIEVEMQFLSNVSIVCESCGGRRFTPETLEVTYKGKNIYDILELTVDEALEFFAPLPKIQRIVQTLHDVGLGYVPLGQPSPFLSGGEAQRIKLARELRRPDTGRTLYLLDEPTTGLHPADIQMLLRALDSLVEKGNTVVVIEHNLDVVKVADYCIDLGPEGGEGGGRVVVAGNLSEVMACPQSYTGQALQQYLQGERANVPRRRGAQHASGGSDIVIEGAMKHNLKNITVRLPKNSFTVVTGLSGSGKTSLVFDTLFAEGQRRFLESLSTYMRRFLGRFDRGQVDRILGLAPAIAIDQKSASRNPRSNVATMTEIYDYLRIVYARAGIPHCPHCHQRLASDSPSSAARKVIAQWTGKMGLVLAPLHLPQSRRGFYLSKPAQFPKAAADLAKEGFTRALVGGETVLLLSEVAVPHRRKPVHLVIDRLEVTANPARLAEAMETAFRYGNGVAFFLPENSKPIAFCQLPACVACDYYQNGELIPRMFSCNSHWGACRACDGLGYLRGDPENLCPECRGDCLQAPYLAVTFGGLSIIEFTRMKVVQARQFLRELQLEENQGLIAHEALREIDNRLKFLGDVGLNYLTLDRRGSTLSGGEAQRIRLANQLGNRLVGVLYVLDEPTVGLHQRDTARLLATLRELVSLGNTVVAVEHDAQTIQAADWVVDLGPGGGDAGGEVVACGSPTEIRSHLTSITGGYLSGRLRRPLPLIRRPLQQGFLRIEKATRNNLQGIDAQFPRQCLTVVTGVSGSGKSSLVVDILQHKLLPYYGLRPDMIAGTPQEGFERITGLGVFRQVKVIDQSPIGRTPHSNPATYTGVFDPIRELFASLPGARQRGYRASRFSFNRQGGRCEACQGSGMLEIEMHFLSDVWVTCEACQGKRYTAETLQVRYHGKNIAQVLEMDVHSALDLFSAVPRIVRVLKILDEIGLGYMKLGQSATTLSGGEAQRLHLASELFMPFGATLYLLDEPTTGLHAADVHRLLDIFSRLLDAGNTLIVIEHNLDVIRAADWIIDLGPEGGDGGGRIVVQGRPEDIAACPHSHTGQFLALAPGCVRSV